MESRQRERQAADCLSPLWVQHLFESTVSVCFVLCHRVCLDPQSICTRLSVLSPSLWASVRVPHESFPQKSSWRVEAAKQPDCLQHKSTLITFTRLLAASLTCLGPGRTLTCVCSPSGEFCLLISVLHFLMLLLNGNSLKDGFLCLGPQNVSHVPDFDEFIQIFLYGCQFKKFGFFCGN